VLAATGAEGARDHLLIGLEDDDHLLRAVAVAGVGLQPGWDRAGQIVERALGDDAPEVRMAAMGALARSGEPEQAEEALEQVVRADPWPEVRVLAVALADRLSPAGGTALLRVAAADPSRTVRLAAMEAAVGVEGQPIDSLIEERISDADEDAEVVAAAARAAGRRCQISAVPALFEVLRRGAEPLAHEDDITAAVAAARAMGRIGGERAAELLEKARRRSNPATDKAIDTAAAELGQRCGNPVAIEDD
jgi:hypothetical protein